MRNNVEFELVQAGDGTVLHPTGLVQLWRRGYVAQEQRYMDPPVLRPNLVAWLHNTGSKLADAAGSLVFVFASAAVAEQFRQRWHAPGVVAEQSYLRWCDLPRDQRSGTMDQAWARAEQAGAVALAQAMAQRGADWEQPLNAPYTLAFNFYVQRDGKPGWVTAQGYALKHALAAAPELEAAQLDNIWMGTSMLWGQLGPQGQPPAPWTDDPEDDFFADFMRVHPFVPTRVTDTIRVFQPTEE